MIGRVEVTRRGVARAGLALAVAAVAACVVYFGGRALGLGGDARSQGEPPVLTISVPEMCVTGQSYPRYGAGFAVDENGDPVYDDDGELVSEIYGPSYSHEDLEAISLTWGISGGTAPYEIVVQGQSLLTNGAEPGSTDVYCAQTLSDLTPLDPNWPHALANPSTVNPGELTFQATVTDANGLSATATATTYIVLDCTRYCDFDIYPPGFTYLIEGHLITIPAGLQLDANEIGISSAECVDDAPPDALECEDSFDLYILSRGEGWITIGESGRYHGYTYFGHFTSAATADSQVAGQTRGFHPDREKIAALGGSIGRLPGGRLDAGAGGVLGLAGEEGG